MNIRGINKTTLLDYPGHVAATIFVGGCNMRCPFCHNSELVLNENKLDLISEKELFAFLEKRQGILEGICITGGEPTLYTDLEVMIRRIREYGYLVKLDTNGYNPEVLKQLIDKKLLNYVAMDIKGAPANYQKASGLGAIDLTKISTSVQLLKESNVDSEFRTTVVKGIHKEEEFHEIGKWLMGAKAYYLQAYRENENVMEKGYESFSKQVMKNMEKIAKQYVDRVEIRGMD